MFKHLPRYFKRKIQLCLIISIGYACQQANSDKKEITTYKDKISLIDLSGDQIDWDKYKDKVVIINLWATWCRPCIAEMPSLVAMRNQLPDNFELILASDEESNKIQQFINRRSFDLNFLKLGNTFESLNVYSLPTTLVIGTNGELIKTYVGAREWNSKKQISELLNLENEIY